MILKKVKLMKDLKNILIVSKKTEIETNNDNWGWGVDSYYARNNIDIKPLKENHKYHHDSLNEVISCFKNHGVNPGVRLKQMINLDDFEASWDLICVVGGDGTFLDVGQYVRDKTPVLGVKSSPQSLGAHYDVNFSNVKTAIDKLFKGEYKVEPQTRIEGTITNGHSITDIALNDIFIGDKYSAGYSMLEIGEKENLVGSSGIIFSSYKGKTGWFDQIPIFERDQDLINQSNELFKKYGIDEKTRITSADAEFKTGEENCVRYKVIQGKDFSKKEYGIIRPGEELKVVSRIFMDGGVAFDGNKPTKLRPRVYDLGLGSSVTIKVSDKPLYVVKFDNL